MSYEDLSIEELIKYRGYRKNIKGDKFSLYISNYPVNAKYLADRVGNPSLVLAELCCSVGITLEYLAPNFKEVIGVDLDEGVLKICRTNLTEAGHIKKSRLLNGDVFDDDILKAIDADIVIYDIPFWYPHEQEEKGNLLDKNPPLKELIDKIRQYVTSEIIIFAPAEWPYEYFKKKLGNIEYERVFIDGKHNRNQIYLGRLMRNAGVSKIELHNQ